MKRRDKRIARKQKVREKHKSQRVQLLRSQSFEQARRDKYPHISIDGGNVGEEVLRYIREALSGIDFADPTSFSHGERRFYQQVKAEGAKAAYQDFREALDEVRRENPKAASDALAQVGLNLGEQIYRKIPKEKLKELIPYYDFQVAASGREFVVKCSALEKESGAFGTVYYTQQKPTVTFSGQEYVFAYSRHAVDALCKRLKPDRLNYGTAGDLAAYFQKCSYVEPVTLYPDQPGFLLYDWCIEPRFSQYEFYVKRILGEDAVDWKGGIPYYRLGYCPVVFENGFAKAKTFLCPGHTSTPEYGKLLQSVGMSQAEKERLKALATVDDASLEMIFRTGNYDHLKWFHENGVPQVVQLEEVVFDYGGKAITKIFDVPALWSRKHELLEAGEIKGQVNS